LKMKIDFKTLLRKHNIRANKCGTYDSPEFVDFMLNFFYTCTADHADRLIAKKQR